jgi:hypothetical protein
MAYRPQVKLKMLPSLRGPGKIRAGGAQYEVDYELDRYADQSGLKVGGSVSGDLSVLASMGEGSPASLVLSDGSELGVLLSNIGHQGADVEASATTGAPSV